jgi:hypothetical protein
VLKINLPDTEKGKDMVVKDKRVEMEDMVLQDREDMVLQDRVRESKGKEAKLWVEGSIPREWEVCREKRLIWVNSVLQI